MQTYLKPDWPPQASIQIMLTTNKALPLSYFIDGYSAEKILQNRTKIVRNLGIHSLATARQVHGTSLIEASNSHSDYLVADALFTRSRKTAVGVFTADCVPVLIAPTDASWVMAIHAGRLGVRDKIVPLALHNIGSTSQLQAWLGPAICEECYSIDLDTAEECAKAGFSQGHLVRKGDKVFCNLRAELVKQLHEFDVKSVSHVNQCTKHHSGWFSHRKGDTERLLSCIWID